jgi:hypothetical protein
MLRLLIAAVSRYATALHQSLALFLRIRQAARPLRNFSPDRESARFRSPPCSSAFP